MASRAAKENPAKANWGTLILAVACLYFAGKEVTVALQAPTPVAPTPSKGRVGFTQEFALKGVSFAAPCSEGDERYEVVAHATYGKLCLDKVSYGDDIIKNELRAGKVWEEEFMPLFQEHIKPGAVVLDVGAHIGTHTLVFSKLVGAEGRVHAFEPNFKVYQEQLMNLHLNQIRNVKANFAAVGHLDAYITMRDTNTGNEGNTTLGVGGNIIELRRLDSYNYAKVDFIKIDVEGAEEGVLRGAGETLQKHRPVILIEIWPKKKAAVLQLLSEWNYEVQKAPGAENYLATPKPI